MSQASHFSLASSTESAQKKLHSRLSPGKLRTLYRVTINSFVFHWWGGCFMRATSVALWNWLLNGALLINKRWSCSNLRLTIIFFTYPHKLCLFLCSSLTRVALEPWTWRTSLKNMNKLVVKKEIYAKQCSSTDEIARVPWAGCMHKLQYLNIFE